MNFILLSDYYSPIVKSGSIIVADLARELFSQGHHVTVVTFVDDQPYRCDDAIENNIRIIRINIPARKFGKLGRLFAEYNYSSKIVHILKKIDNVLYDAIICYSPSIFYGKAISWLKGNHKTKAYLIIRDIFPKWAVSSLGIITG